MKEMYGILKVYSPQSGGGDAEWYVGTQDSIPVFMPAKPGVKICLFTDSEHAEKRREMIELLHDIGGRKLVVKPLHGKDVP